jgi:hypothetical protein
MFQHRTHFRKIPENFFCSWSTNPDSSAARDCCGEYLEAIGVLPAAEKQCRVQPREGALAACDENYG